MGKQATTIDAAEWGQGVEEFGPTAYNLKKIQSQLSKIDTFI